MPAADPPPELPYSGELARKALHLVALVIPAGMLVLPERIGLALLIPLALLAVGVDIARTRRDGLGAFVDRTLGFMMRSEERESEAGSRFNGATWVMITAAVLLIVFPPRIAAAAMAMAMIGDAAGAVVGRPLGRHRWPGSKRTVEGTTAFVIGGMLAGLFFPYLSLPVKLAGVAAAALAELIPVGIDDNFVLPMVCAATLLALTL